MLRRSPSTRALLPAAALWLFGASCAPVVPANGDVGRVQEVTAFATPGCDVAAIEDRAGETTCASCAIGEGATEICGDVEVARCESREDSRGEPCSFCATGQGEVFYDSCFSDDPVPFVNCESSEAPSDATAPERAGDFVCETCTDADGVVVAQRCEPRSDECHEEASGGGSCRVCTRGDDVVVRQCRQPDIAPRSCEAYGDVQSVGRCVDCYGEGDELLSHSCVLAVDAFISCAESITPEGLACVTCFDANGAQVERSCDDATTAPQQCALLDYREQSCVVCIDERGDAAVLDCDRKGCLAGAECAPPPACTLERGPDRQVCRTCPTDSGELEQACVVETNLQCGPAFNDVIDHPCVSCRDLSTGVEVYRRCDNGGDGTSSLPPTCSFAENALGELCEVCIDSQSNETVYASCASQTCSDLGDFALFSAAGVPLFLEGQPAVASCSKCVAALEGTTVAENFRASCSLVPDCPVELANPDAACEGTVTFRVRPRGCANPWERAGSVGVPDNEHELLQVLAFALESSLALVAAQHTGGAPSDPTCIDGCACDRSGPHVELVARPADAALVIELFHDVIEPCASSADCATGGECRLDGACG